ncbi:MAG TPA: ATP-grasp domain-containing protein [Candidatus Acidoferrales bacterium]|nr:ATP-grasp domain-containing protein [Candidatus Acidoferrales bacterium]
MHVECGDRTENLNVLVAGVGGNVSQGILKALALSPLRCRTVAACVHPLSVGLFTADAAYVSPLASCSEFVPWLLKVCRRERIHAVLSGVEPVLARISEHAEEIRRETGAIPIVSQPDKLAIADDKLRTCQWLRDNGFAYPLFADSTDQSQVDELVRRCGFPLIAKPRSGKGANGFCRIEDESALRAIMQRPGYIVQEYLGSDDAEFTAGCVCDREGIVRGCICMKRDLLHGTTYRAEVCDHPAVREQACNIASKLRPVGPVNIQSRIHRGRPVCFEINLRFSGTTPIRARFGFNEVDFALRHFVLGEAPSDLPVVKSGVALRYWNEMYLDPAAASQLRSGGELRDPGAHQLKVEDYGIR